MHGAALAVAKLSGISAHVHRHQFSHQLVALHRGEGGTDEKRGAFFAIHMRVLTKRGDKRRHHRVIKMQGAAASAPRGRSHTENGPSLLTSGRLAGGAFSRPEAAPGHLSSRWVQAKRIDEWTAWSGSACPTPGGDRTAVKQTGSSQPLLASGWLGRGARSLSLSLSARGSARPLAKQAGPCQACRRVGGLSGERAFSLDPRRHRAFVK